MFSFLITGDANTTGNSYIDFGTPDTSVMTSESDIVWINSTNVGGWWTSNVIGWRYTGSSDEIGLTSTWALTDTGSSCLYGPSSVVNTVIADATALLTGPTIYDAGWGILFECAQTATMPSFDILFGDHWFTVEGKDYVVPVNAQGACAFCLLADDSGYWLLGDVFMRGWYNIHDYTNNRMGFVPYQGSTKSKAEAKTSDPAIIDPPAGTC